VAGVSRIAITGGTGFDGRHVAERLRTAGDEVVLLSRSTGFDLARPDAQTLADALDGCAAIVHTAGINREIGKQTYDSVHIRGTQALVAAARTAGVEHIAMMSFVRARPDGPTAYHRSKWAAEAIVRESGIRYTILKSGVIHGRGDPRLIGQTVAVLGPEAMPLGEAVRRVARVIGREPRYVRLPVLAYIVLARVFEATMRVPLLSVAQIHILAEGVVEPDPFAPPPPDDLAPRTPFNDDTIRAGLPEPGRFRCRDLRWWPA
jgi:NADH dehydrogenase